MMESKKSLSETQLMNCVLNQVDVEIRFADEADPAPDYVGPIERFDNQYIKTKTDYYVRSLCVVCLVNENDENGAIVRSS